MYDQFKRDFGDYPHLVGTQPIPVFDPNVTGSLPRAAYDDMMCNMRVMFYHSRQDRRLDYHPLEAIRAGMPLIFMAGGMLDKFGGIGLSGCCNTIKEAHQKLQRVLSGDQKLIRNIRQSQAQLLESMKSDTCELAWRAGLERLQEAQINVARVASRTDPAAAHSRDSADKVPRRQPPRSDTVSSRDRNGRPHGWRRYRGRFWTS